MSADGKYPILGKHGLKSVLKEMLDFGPEITEPTAVVHSPLLPPSLPSHDVTSRLRNIVKQIQDISRRIDDLSERL